MSPLSYRKGVSTPPLLEHTIGQDLLSTVARHPDREALVDVSTGRRWTYQQFLTEVKAVARGLIGSGLQPGDRVAVWAPNCPEWTFVQYATALVGMILVTVNPAFRSSELAYVVTQSGMRTLIAVPAFKGSNYRAMIDQIRPSTSALRDVVLIGDESWDAMITAGQGIREDQLSAAIAAVRHTDPINIQYTSGTTGSPKGATLTHRNILNNGYMIGELLHYTQDDRICIPVPFYHCFGMVLGNLAATSHGAAMVIPAPAFDPAITLQTVADEECTSVYGVPTMFIAMLNSPNFDQLTFPRLRTGVMAGSPCPPEIMKRVIERMGASEIAICYGMTETSPVSMQTRREDSFATRVDTVGSVHPHLEAAIVDPVTGTRLPVGEVGEFCVRGYSVMLGYWNEPAKTAEVIDGDGWMHSGDLGLMDADGHVQITGRIKDMVLRGGENIYPREIEDYLLRHPDIIDVQIIGVPDERYGEELMAWIRMVPGAPPLDVAATRAFCAGHLAHYKIPKYVHIVEEFPMTVTGKVRKAEMREMAAAILAQTVEA